MHVYSYICAYTNFLIYDYVENSLFSIQNF
jgi:hypothetical protein